MLMFFLTKECLALTSSSGGHCKNRRMWQSILQHQHKAGEDRDHSPTEERTNHQREQKSISQPESTSRCNMLLLQERPLASSGTPDAVPATVWLTTRVHIYPWSTLTNGGLLLQLTRFWATWVMLLEKWSCINFCSSSSCLLVHLINPLSPNSDQHQISPCNINAFLTPEVMRIKGMITQREFSWYFNNFSPVLLWEKYGDKIREFVFWY